MTMEFANQVKDGDMFWHYRGFFGQHLETNIAILASGDYRVIPDIFCALAEKHQPSKLLSAITLHNALKKMTFKNIISIDIQMRSRSPTEMDWFGIHTAKLKIESLFTRVMNIDDRRAVVIFSSLNPNGYLREKALELLVEFDDTLPFIILRLNDWVPQVRQAAAKAFAQKLQSSSADEIILSIPYMEKLIRSTRSVHDEFVLSFFNKLASPQYRHDLIKLLQSDNIDLRRICIRALIFSMPPDYELVFQHLKCEPDPFLGRIIFNWLDQHGQDLTEAAHDFLHKKQPIARQLALAYLYKHQKAAVLLVAHKMLLDNSAKVRIFSQKIVKESASEFDIKAFYRQQIESCNSKAAIIGFFDMASKDDIIFIEKYLSDSRSAVVQAAMIALMRLDSDQYSSLILEKLGDASPGIVKIAYQLISNYGAFDYKRIQAIFKSSSFEHVKVKCADLLFLSSKWDSLIYALCLLSCEVESVSYQAMNFINKWLYRVNQSFADPSDKQRKAINELITIQGKKIQKSVKNQILLVLQ